MSITKPIMTVNNDKYHTASIDHSILARQSERGVQITVNVNAELAALGYDAYVDFLQPNGVSYFKGPYDCSSGTFLMSIGQDDTLLDYEGLLTWQFVLREEALDRWKSRVYKIKVEGSVIATSAAIIPTLPVLDVPDPYPAANISVQDAGLYFLQNNAEDVLQEAGSQIDALNMALNDTDDNVALKINLAGGSGNPFTAMPYVGTAPIVESGSNANGEYVKYADGTMICYYANESKGWLTNQAVGSVFYSAVEGATTDVFTFPVAFIAAPKVLPFVFRSDTSIPASTGIVFGYAYGRASSNITTTGVRSLVLVGASVTSVGSMGYMAIGKWK